MFKKVLIANRGEIAVRIIRTCRKLGIQTVAVYSEVDADALHVRQADEAFLIGEPHATKSYLNINKILEVAVSAGADSIHPGYGFLSENESFARSCEEQGMTFIGPKPEVIGRMGSKIAARQAMEVAGVPVVPGVTRSLGDESEAIQVANEIGYPIMLKASAGGGGIGMQVVHHDAELQKAFAGNQKRAQDFFGDGAMYIEKFIKNPRHIEIQILADNKGNIVYLWERDCSVQRRHQKVVEEAPSPFLDEQTRKAIGKAAVTAAKSIGYTNAGTIEFLVDENRAFYFLEMNTRLQVEHPVTEEITGLDLVEQQLRVAAGESLAFTQDEVKLEGHAIEVRIYAEDPKTFYPSPGKITVYKMPLFSYVRNETAVYAGSVVTPFYDPMIAKLVVRGKDRKEALERLTEALTSYKIEGIKTNIPMIMEVIHHEVFKSGNHNIHFVEEHIQKKTNK